MLEDFVRSNDRIWAGHSRTFEDVTHTVGGIGIGLLLCPALRGSNRGAGFGLIALSAALHLYAYATARQRISFFGR